jgi:hypothetical protein
MVNSPLESQKSHIENMDLSAFPPSWKRLLVLSHEERDHCGQWLPNYKGKWNEGAS